MRLPNTAHTSRPWRIHELTRDFRLYDAWALPTPGGPGDFPRLVRQIASGDPSDGASRAGRALWAIRWKVGELLGWDGPDAGLGSRVPTLRERLPADLRGAPSGPDFSRFRSLYLLDDEWAAEIANRTVHGVMHVGWVEDGAGGYRGQMAVLVKPNGLLGTAYMAAIMPFRHLIVYPPLMRDIGREWRKPTYEPRRVHADELWQEGTRAVAVVAAPGERSVRVAYPVLFIFDGRCGVCTRFVRILRGLESLTRPLHGRNRVRMVPYQMPGVTRSTGLSLEDCRASAWAVSSDGERYRGAEAIGVAVSGVIGTRIPHALYKLPLVGNLQDLAYGWIAASRRRLPGDKPYCSQYPGNCQ